MITLGDAIAAGRLVQYEYFPETVYLSAEEEDDYEKWTKRFRIT